MSVNILTRTAPASNGALLNTGKVAVFGPVGTAASGSPILCQSIPDFETGFGVTRSTATEMWDWLDIYFREGGNQAYVYDYGAAGQYTTALANFDQSYGWCQVAIVGETPGAPVYSAIDGHCASFGRIGLLDVASSDVTVALLTAKGVLAQALNNKENVGLFGSWVTAPPPAGVVGSPGRSVPASAVIAALCNRVDQAGNPNQPAGGKGFSLQYATGFVFDPQSANDQQTLKNNSVNFFHNAWGVLENYSFLTPLYTGAPAPTQTPFWQLNCARTRMWMTAQAAVIGEAYYMQDIDGQGVVAGKLGSDLDNMLAGLYEAGALFGASAADAYNVNVGSTVNTPATEAAGQLNAVVQAVLSPYADEVNITLVSVPVTGVISA